MIWPGTTRIYTFNTATLFRGARGVNSKSSPDLLGVLELRNMTGYLHEDFFLAPLLEVRLKSRKFGICHENLGCRLGISLRLLVCLRVFRMGETITAQTLSMIDQAGDFLIQFGFRQVRVRQHEDLARIEVSPHDLPTCWLWRIPYMRSSRKSVTIWMDTALVV
jgi:hypothetical protein